MSGNPHDWPNRDKDSLINVFFLCHESWHALMVSQLAKEQISIESGSASYRDLLNYEILMEKWKLDFTKE